MSCSVFDTVQICAVFLRKKGSTAKLAIELMKKGSHGKLNLPNKKTMRTQREFYTKKKVVYEFG
jgi:hypothetical protein